MQYHLSAFFLFLLNFRIFVIFLFLDHCKLFLSSLNLTHLLEFIWFLFNFNQFDIILQSIFLNYLVEETLHIGWSGFNEVVSTNELSVNLIIRSSIKSKCEVSNLVEGVEWVEDNLVLWNWRLIDLEEKLTEHYTILKLFKHWVILDVDWQVFRAVFVIL